MADMKYLTDVHYLLQEPHRLAGNAACLNGSAHITKTADHDAVDCPKCLDRIAKGYHKKHRTPNS